MYPVADRQVRKHREHAGRDAERRDGDADKRPLTEERHVEHRPLLTEFHDDEHHQQESGAEQRREDERARPAARVATQDPEDDQEESRGERHQTLDVGPACAFVSGLGDPRERDGEREGADRDVDEEDPAPPEAVGEDATDERSAGHSRTDRGAPSGERAESIWSTVFVADGASAVANSAAPPSP